MSQPRILFITESGDLNVSGTVRAQLYEQALKSRSLHAAFVTRLHYRLSKFIERPSAWMNLLGKCGGGLVLFPAQRFLAHRNIGHICKIARDYDIIYLIKSTSFELVAALRELPNKRLVYDLNDALWLPRWRHYLQGRLEDVLKMVDAVTCDNPYGTGFASQFNSESFVVSDAPQLELFEAARHHQVHRPESPVVLGWIGSVSNCDHLYAAWEALEQLFDERQDITLRLVGTAADSPKLPRFEKVRATACPRYDQQTMVKEVLGMDIGLFPMFNVQEAQGRGILKATVYMSGQAAVVTSPVGQCNELITHGHNGMLASTSQQWYDTLNLLIDDAVLRKRLTDNALAHMRQEFTLEKCLDRLLDVLIHGQGRRVEANLEHFT